jgi:hypothetical protein
VTLAEFATWKAEATASEFYWRYAKAFMETDRSLVIYKGVQAGLFVQITNTGLMTLGRYHSALPDITRAHFDVLGTKQFPDWMTAYENAGVEFGAAWVVQWAEQGRRTQSSKRRK